MSEEKKVVRVTKDGSTATYKETGVKGSTHIMTSDNEDLKIKAMRAGDAVTDLVDSALDKAAGLVKTKTDELVKSGALQPGYAAAKKDSADIGRLGPLVTELAATFEDTMTVIQGHPYEEQAKLLTGYKKLIEEQINVVDSRIHFVKRVR
ncbi:MAG TPA: hypothetical protein VF172_11460 [Nitrososphaera sp.]